MGNGIANLLPETEPPDTLPVLKEHTRNPWEALQGAYRETLSMDLPLLARLLESPARRR